MREGKGGRKCTRAKDEAGKKGEREREERERRASLPFFPLSFFLLTFDEADRERVGHCGGSDRSLQGTGGADVAQEEVLVVAVVGQGGGGGSEGAAASFFFEGVFEKK